MVEVLKRPIARLRNAQQIDGRSEVVGAETVTIMQKDGDGKITFATGTTVPTAATSGYAKGCFFVDTAVATGLDGVYKNIGTSSSCYFVPSSSPVITTATTTADGLTTGIIPDLGDMFVTVTSASATNAATLPAASASKIGRVIKIYVGANGLELLTPASGNNTINTVDSDGTNQLDVEANSLLTCTQVSATGWYAFQQTATTITVVAPDND